MKWDLKRPCENCPFLKKGGIRLRRDRIRELVSGALDPQGATFACHKMVEWDEDGYTEINAKKQKHCAGALIFAEKHDTANQGTRIAERLGLYDARILMDNKEAVASVFDSLPQMLRTAIR